MGKKRTFTPGGASEGMGNESFFAISPRFFFRPIACVFLSKSLEKFPGEMWKSYSPLAGKMANSDNSDALRLAKENRAFHTSRGTGRAMIKIRHLYGHEAANGDRKPTALKIPRLEGDEADNGKKPSSASLFIQPHGWRDGIHA